MEIFEELESNVRSYVRLFPAVFDTAQGSCLFDDLGNRFIDFFAGGGALNYGHNHPTVKKALIDYLKRDGVMHSLDKATVAKRAFLRKFRDTILTPRNLTYKIQFIGPTGTDAVEAALRLARRVKRRASIVAFTNAYHGMTLGSLAVTGNDFYRNEYDGVQGNTSFFPFDGYLGPDVDTIDYLRGFISDGGSGVDLPAAIIVEAVQGEGGVNIARPAWLRKLERLCRDFDILLIIDDIQMGNGRTGAFFSFEEAAIRPDMVILSKSIAGGLPMAILLMRPELDRWRPGEHTGTFRGNNLAFVAATELLAYWDDDQLSKSVAYRGEIMDKALQGIATGYPELSMAVRGRGMIWGLEFPQRGLAAKVSRRCFEGGLLIETAGTRNQVLKFLPPLIMEEDLLRKGLRIIDDAIAALARG